MSKVHITKEEIVEHAMKQMSDFIGGKFGRKFESVLEGIVKCAYNAGAESKGDGYEKGLEDAWQAAKDLLVTDVCDKEYLFGTGSVLLTMDRYSPLEVSAKLSEDKNIKVGDEVVDPNGLTAVVTNTDTHYHLLYPHNGKTWKCSKDTKLTKTGRNYQDSSFSIF